MVGASQTLPSRSRAGRVFVYLLSMFPPAVMLPSAFATFYSAYFGLQALAGPSTLELGWRSLCGAATALLYMLLLRVYDELKDVETDLELGRAGDERYRDRPIVTGAVTVPDIVLLRNVTLVALVALNVALGFPLPLSVFAFALLCAWLSSRWYFYPPMKQNLLLAFVTHNPLTLVVFAYVTAVAVEDHGTELLQPAVVPLLVGLWLPIAAWETSRKVRMPEEETSYVTYSKILGPRRAATMPLLFVAVATAALLWVSREASLPGWYSWVVGGAGGVCVARCLQFIVAPTSARARLRPFVEVFSVAATVGLVAAMIASHGLEWRN